MTHTMNGKQVSTNELISFVIASVLEDVDKHFDEYAENCITDWEELNEGDMDAIEKWKPRVFGKINTRLGKRNMVEQDG